jgi:hypothetical protein
MSSKYLAYVPHLRKKQAYNSTVLSNHVCVCIIACVCVCEFKLADFPETSYNIMPLEATSTL